MSAPKAQKKKKTTPKKKQKKKNKKEKKKKKIYKKSRHQPESFHTPIIKRRLLKNQSRRFFIKEARIFASFICSPIFSRILCVSGMTTTDFLLIAPLLVFNIINNKQLFVNLYCLTVKISE